MMLPPHNTCNAGQQCTFPTWEQALLEAPTTTGTVLARCADAPDNNCSFNDITYPAGTSEQLKLADGCTVSGCTNTTREVLAWCKTTGALNVGDPPQPLLRVSFTNAKSRDIPLGYGWWDVIPDTVTNGQSSPVNTTSLATC
jgi:hypothetical protein